MESFFHCSRVVTLHWPGTMPHHWWCFLPQKNFRKHLWNTWWGVWNFSSQHHYSCFKWPAFNLTSNLDVIYNMDRRLDWGHLRLPSWWCQMLKESVEMHAPAAVKESVEAGHVAGGGAGHFEFSWGVEVSGKKTPDMNEAFAYGDIRIFLDWFMMGGWNFMAFWNNPYITKLSRFVIIPFYTAKSPGVDWPLFRWTWNWGFVGDLDCFTGKKGKVQG